MDESGIGQQLKALRRQINELELQFARLAAGLTATYDPSDATEMLTPIQWLREECRMTSHAALSAINIGEQRMQLTQSTTALLTGEIGFSHLSWLANTAARVAGSKTATSLFDENTLLKHAKKLSFQRFRRKCEQLIHEVDHEAFVAQQTIDTNSRTLKLTTLDDGFMELNGFFDPEGGAVILAAIDPFSKRTSEQDGRDMRQRRADALVEVCNHVLDSGAVPAHGGQRPHINVTTTLETLCDFIGSPAAEMETGAVLSGTSMQRLACDATVVRVLLNTESQVIDVSRAQRVVSGATRRALNVRDKGCIWPGCDRPATWTQAHHIVHWIDGGATDTDNLVLLCRRHHWMVHEGGYAIIPTENDGVLTFTPFSGMYPAGRDPTFAVA